MMNLNLPSDINTFAESLVSDGRFDSEEAANIEGARMLMGREQLKAEIQVGIDQLDKGLHFDEETVFAEVNAEIYQGERALPNSEGDHCVTTQGASPKLRDHSGAPNDSLATKP